jgi:hypothetical protein
MNAPPSTPRTPSRLSYAEIAKQERASRLQMIAMLGLGMVLIGGPLYLWRRPAEQPGEATAPRPPQLSEALPFAPAGAVGAAAQTDASLASKSAFSLSDVKVLSCRDTKKELNECGKIPVVEEALTKALREHATCLPAAAGGGTVQYLAEVNFDKKRVGIGTPRDGRSVRNTKLLKPCTVAIKHALEALDLKALEHAHLHYRLSVIATYPP